MKSNNNSNSTSSNLNTGAVRAEYMYSSFIPLDPVRATCLRYAKTFQKVEHATGNRAFFQFDGEGVTLRAQDKNALGLAQKQFTLMSKANMIEILPTPGYGEEDLKQLMLKEIRSQVKYSKVFVQLVSMEAFRIMAQQLKGFGYGEPLRLWEKTAKIHKRFAFLVCHEAQFQAVRQEIVKLLKNVPKEQKPQTGGVKQVIQSGQEGTQMRNSQTQQQQLYSPWVSMQYVKKDDNSNNNTKQINDDKKNLSLEQPYDSQNQFVKKEKVEKLNIYQANPLKLGGNEFNLEGNCENIDKQVKIEELNELPSNEGIVKINYAQDLESTQTQDMHEKPDEAQILEYPENQHLVSNHASQGNVESEATPLKNENDGVISDDKQNISQEIILQEKFEELQRKHKTSGSKGNNLLIVPESHQLEAEYSTRDDEEQDDKDEIIIPESSRQLFQQILAPFETPQGEIEIQSRFHSLTEEQKQRNFLDLLAAQDSLLSSINEMHNEKKGITTTAATERNQPFNNNSSEIDQQSQYYGHLSSPPSRSLRSSVSGSIMSFSLTNHNSDVHEILRRDRITMDSLPRMVVVVSGCVGESEWVLKELSEVRWEAVVIDACVFAWLFHTNRVKHSDKRIRVVREDRHLAVVEGLPRDVIAVIASTKDLVLNTQQDSLKTAAKWVDEEVLESLKHCNIQQGQMQQQQQQLNSEAQSHQQQQSSGNPQAEASTTPSAPSSNSPTPVIFAELMSFEDLKGQSRKFKNKALQRVCAQTYRALLGSKDKQTGCLLIHNQKFVIRANSPLRSLMPSQSPLANNRDMFINSERMAQSNHLQHSCGQQQQQQSQQQQQTFKKQTPQRNPSNNSRTSSNSSSIWTSQSSGNSSFLSNSKLFQQQQQRLMASCFSKKNGCKEIMRNLRSFLRLRYLQLAGCVGQTNGKGGEDQEMTVAQRGEEEMAVARALSLYTQMIPFDLSAIIRISSLADEEDSDEEDSRSLNHAQTYIVTYKQQTFCLKEYQEISAAKLNKAICAYKEHESAENTQLLHIYSILIIPCNLGNNTAGCSENSSKMIQVSHKQLNALHSDESAFKSSSSASSSSAMNFSMYILSDLKYMNLRQALEGRYIDSDQKSLLVCHSLVSALQNIHSKLQDGQPMFHGNLKPNNVLLDTTLRVTLCDLNPDPVQSKGTCAYFAPEVQQRKQRPDLASDMFSLGLLLYEIVHRHSLAKLDRKKLKKLSYEYFPKTLQPLKTMIQKCLLKDPLTRPSAKNILMEIAALQETI